MAKLLEFGEYAPDLTDIGTAVSQNITGVLPRADGYGPFKTFQAFTQALAAACRGYFFARKSDGSIAIFAGTATRLYQMDNTSFAWTDVSKGGAAYSGLVDDDNWQFKQFNDLVIAVQNNTVPQKFTLSSSMAFADLGGSPPQASHIAIINGFVVLSGLLSNPRRVQWSDLFAPETWTAGVGLSDFQDLADGGTVHGISGGDFYGLVFQDEPIRSLVYAPGSAVTFQITRISENDPLFAQYSVVETGGRTFFLSAQGFKMVIPGGVPTPIGKERIDRMFFADVDNSSLRLVIGAGDPTGTRVFWAYKSQQGSAGLFDKVLCYDWSISDNGKWTVLPISGEYLATLARPGLTLEQLDAIAPGALTVLGAADNGSGAIRLTLDAVSNAFFSIAGQNFIVVQGVVGTTEANGSWPVTIIDPTHIDLIGSTFTNAYISGGAIGGSLDALPFSLDSISKAALASLSAIDGDHKAGFFTAGNMEASLETPEVDAGSLIFISGARLMTDAANAMLSIGSRMSPNAAISYSAESSMDVQGFAPQLVESRYNRAKVRIPAGSTWSYCRGVQPEAQPAGDR